MKLNKLQIYVIAILILLVGIHVVPFAEEIPRVGPLIKGVKHVTKPVTKAITKFFHRGEIEAFHKSLENVIQKLKDNPRLSGPVRFGMDLVTFEVVDKVIVMKLINGNSMSYEVKFQPNDDDQNVDCYVNDILIGFIPYQISQDFQTISDEYIPDALHDMANGVIKIYQKRYETAYNQ